ncbi:MAG: ATP synthase F0 subunit C [Clostridiales bacterium]|jgi:F-type H+-transporting ATPase subunit c|nr:ATP synthase F0 subunit C [Clostridiales bacterium]
MEQGLATIMSAAHIAAAFALFNGAFTTFGQARIAAQAIESMARQPEASSNIRTTMFLGLALAETSGIYGLLIAIIMLFANPLVNIYISLMG